MRSIAVVLAALAVAALVSTSPASSRARDIGLPPNPSFPKAQHPIDPLIHKIRHVVVIMQENRSFDSYFGTYTRPEENDTSCACFQATRNG